MVKVKVFVDEKFLGEYEFKSGEREIYIGRHVRHPIRLDDNAVSADHARLTLGSAVVLEDLKSTNGTLLNGAIVARPTPLNPGDTIQIAKFRLRVDDLRDLDFTEAETIVIEPKTIPLTGGNSTMERTGFFSYSDYLKQRESQ